MCSESVIDSNPGFNRGYLRGSFIIDFNLQFNGFATDITSFGYFYLKFFISLSETDLLKPCIIRQFYGPGRIFGGPVQDFKISTFWNFRFSGECFVVPGFEIVDRTIFVARAIYVDRATFLRDLLGSSKLDPPVLKLVRNLENVNNFCTVPGITAPGAPRLFQSHLSQNLHSP